MSRVRNQEFQEILLRSLVLTNVRQNKDEAVELDSKSGKTSAVRVLWTSSYLALRS